MLGQETVQKLTGSVQRFLLRTIYGITKMAVRQKSSGIRWPNLDPPSAFRFDPANLRMSGARWHGMRYQSVVDDAESARGRIPIHDRGS
jgi:hypothetical protein